MASGAYQMEPPPIVAANTPLCLRRWGSATDITPSGALFWTGSRGPCPMGSCAIAVGPACRSDSFQNRTVVPMSSVTASTDAEVARLSGSA